jgi:hypothetical protein
MSIWVGISPLIGAGSLEGFAVGATVSGALFLAITAPVRVRRRQAAAAGTRGVPVSASGMETSSAETGTFDAGLCGVEAFEAEAMAQPQPRMAQPQTRMAQPQTWMAQPQTWMAQPQTWMAQPPAPVAQPQPGAQDDTSLTSPTGRDGAYRSRHRLGDSIPGRAARGGVPVGRSRRVGRTWRVGRTRRCGVPLGRTWRVGRTRLGGVPVGRSRRGGAFPPSAFPGWASRDDAQPDTPFPEVAFSDVAFPDGTFRSSRRPEVRRLPRHAAPTVSFGTKVSGKVTGLFAARPLAGGAPS